MTVLVATTLTEQLTTQDNGIGTKAFQDLRVDIGLPVFYKLLIPKL